MRADNKRIDDTKVDIEEDEAPQVSLNAEMSESICKCFTGRLSRLINLTVLAEWKITLKFIFEPKLKLFKSLWKTTLNLKKRLKH